ncbi:MAG: biopolymer transporter ExbD [Thermoguttaceae bacterium]|jgi:biopolymer transport protein ExbD
MAMTEVKAEPNLTPILDMVFQLITFFMLVINFKSAELDMNLNLPVVGSARPVNDPNAKLLVLNINKNSELTVYGQVRDVEKYIAGEAKYSRDQAGVTREQIEQGEKDLPETVVIRAHREAPFSVVNRVIKACQDQGYRKFALKALSKEA